MTTTETPAPAQPVTTCPPSRVVDMIVRWDEVQDGDLVLGYQGELEPVTLLPYGNVWQPEGCVSVILGGSWYTPHAGRLTAVRRYIEGAQITLTAGQAQTAAAALDEAADDRANRAGTGCRDCAESVQRYCPGCQDLLDTAGEYRELRDELTGASR